MAYKFVIFDFDGTLADTNEGIVRVFQETFRRLGFKVPSHGQVTSTIGLALTDTFKAAEPGLSDEECDKAAVLYRSLFPEIAYPLVTAFPGTVQTLAELHGRGVRMAVATSRSHGSLEFLAGQTGVSGYMEGLFGAQDVVNHKPAPDLVNLILDKYSLDRKDVLVVGDAVYDLMMGKGAGCRVCAAAWGNQSRELLSTADPDYIIGSIRELPAIVL